MKKQPKTESIFEMLLNFFRLAWATLMGFLKEKLIP